MNYWLYNPVGQKIVVSRNVNFKEILNNGYSSFKIDEGVPFSAHCEEIPENEQTIPEPEVPLDDSHEDELLVQFISVVEDAPYSQFEKSDLNSKAC